MEIIPVAIQTAVIVAFLIVTRQDFFQSFAAAILSLIWLRVNKSKMAEDFGDIRLRRRLFTLLGEWLNRDDAEEEFDAALERYQMIDSSIEDDVYREVVTAAGLADSFRGFVNILVLIYLCYLIVAGILSGQLL